MATVVGEMQANLGQVVGANLNSTGDIAIPINAAKYILTQITLSNPSVNMAALTVTATIRDAAGGAGNAIVAAIGALTVLTGSTKYLALTLGGIALTDVLAVATLYLNIAVATGTPGTVDVTVQGARVA